LIFGFTGENGINNTKMFNLKKLIKRKSIDLWIHFSLSISGRKDEGLLLQAFPNLQMVSLDEKMVGACS